MRPMAALIVDLIAEINGIASALKARARMLSSCRDRSDISAMADNMVASFGNRFTSAVVDVVGGARLYDAVVAAELDDGIVQSLTTLIDAKLSRASPESHMAHVRAVAIKPQLLYNIHTFLTASRWNVITDTAASCRRKQLAIIGGLKDVGVRSLHEHTKRPAIAILVWACYKPTCQWPSYQLIYEWQYLAIYPLRSTV